MIGSHVSSIRVWMGKKDATKDTSIPQMELLKIQKSERISSFFYEDLVLGGYVLRLLPLVLIILLIDNKKKLIFLIFVFFLTLVFLLFVFF